jgi:hypothetical protein
MGGGVGSQSMRAVKEKLMAEIAVDRGQIQVVQPGHQYRLRIDGRHAIVGLLTLEQEQPAGVRIEWFANNGVDVLAHDTIVRAGENTHCRYCSTALLTIEGGIGSIFWDLCQP